MIYTVENSDKTSVVATYTKMIAKVRDILSKPGGSVTVTAHDDEVLDVVAAPAKEA